MDFNISRVMATVDKEVESKLEDKAKEGVEVIKGLLGSPGKSSPGAPPGLQTGAYRDSISYKKVSEFDYQIYTDSPLGSILEFGTRNMAPRPHFRPGMLILENKQ